MPKKITDTYTDDEKKDQIAKALANGGKYCIEYTKEETNDQYKYIKLYRLSNGKLQRICQYNKKNNKDNNLKEIVKKLNSLKSITDEQYNSILSIIS